MRSLWKDDLDGEVIRNIAEARYRRSVRFRAGRRITEKFSLNRGTQRLSDFFRRHPLLSTPRVPSPDGHHKKMRQGQFHVLHNIELDSAPTQVATLVGGGGTNHRGRPKQRGSACTSFSAFAHQRYAWPVCSGMRLYLKVVAAWSLSTKFSISGAILRWRLGRRLRTSSRPS